MIRSHAGVRSDLFRRPLDKTRITDFFGGVAQAEVFPPTQESARTVFESVQPPEPSQHVAIPPESDPVPPRSHPDGAQDNTTLLLESEGDAWHTRWKDIRKWTSVLLVASLVAWVSFA